MPTKQRGRGFLDGIARLLYRRSVVTQYPLPRQTPSSHTPIERAWPPANGPFADTLSRTPSRPSATVGKEAHAVSYAEPAADEESEREALEWSEGLIGETLE